MAICRTEHRFFAYIKGKSATYFTRNYCGGSDMDFWCIEANGYKRRSSALSLAKAEKEHGEYGQKEIGVVDVTLEYTVNEKGCERPCRFKATHIPLN